MGDTTSEATSPYSTSGLAYTSTQDHSNHWLLRQQVTEGMMRSHVNQDQFLQGEASEASHQPIQGGSRRGRAKMSEDQRRERKKQIDRRYREGKKTRVNKMTAEIERLSSENRKLKEDYAWLSTKFDEETRRLSTENSYLIEEFERLSLEKNHLGERIRELQGKGPAEILQNQNSYISQPTSQVDNQSAYFQEHCIMESNNEEAVHMDQQQCMDSNNEGAVDGLDGLGINDLLQIFTENGMIPDGADAINDFVLEQLESSHSELCEMAKLTEFLMKLDAEVTSNIDLSDFIGLDREQKRVGRYTFPWSLIPTVERINNVYGDVSLTSLISPSVSGTIYVLFCATLKEMEHTQLEEVTEDRMLKWRDVIKDALRLKFDVGFAMEHLKKIACAYFGRPRYLHLQGIDAKIATLEAEANDWKTKRANVYEESKMCIDAAKTFTGVPVSTGLFSLVS